MSEIFVNDWKAFADECHKETVNKDKEKARVTPLPKLSNFSGLNEYPTLNAEEFAKLSLARVDTLLNNMRVTSGRGADIRADIVKRSIKNQIADFETIVLDHSNKPKILTLRKPCNGQIAFIDWITVTFHVSTLGQKYIYTGEDKDKYMAICQSAVADLSAYLVAIFGKPFAEITQNQKGLNYYDYSFRLGNGLGVVCIGGQRGTVQVSLSGVGCATARKGWENRLHDFLKNKCVRSKITRVDLAHDDLQGEYLDVYKIDEIETAGGFHCGGAKPSVRHDGNWKHNDPYNEGLTLYIGKRGNSKMARFYEKGKEQGDKNSKWVRAEVEFKSADRIIPLDVLLNPSEYFMGAYPCFGELFKFESSTRIKSNRKIAKVTLEHSFDWIKKQTGKYIAYFQTFLSDAEILERLKHDDPNIIPDRLYIADDYCRNQLQIA